MRSYSGPSFYYQLGHQDQKTAKELLSLGIGRGVIFSPRHLKVQQLEKYIQEYNSITPHPRIIIDPQIYNPKFQHSDGYDYGDIVDSTYALEDDITLEQLVNEALDFQLQQGVDTYIIPCNYISQFNNAWLEQLIKLSTIGEEWKREHEIHNDVLLTVACSSSIISNQEFRYELLNTLTGLDVDGFYTVFGNTDGNSDILPKDLEYIKGLCDITFRLKQNDYIVIDGYTSYAAILQFPFGLDGFASGGFNNRRLFDPMSFDETDNDGPRTPKPRFWSIEILNSLIYPDELELISEEGLLEKLVSDPENVPTFAKTLYNASSPAEASESWKRKASWQHYFWSCQELVNIFKDLNSKQRVDKVFELLENAVEIYKEINRRGIRLRGEAKGEHIIVWLNAFTSYFEEVKDELFIEYN
ncbi:hypothetical protein [Oceanobacillus caeni]|uniref:hypothetical protein n=1 Tax=Oceanobacillus caeni TaxID=405946 RepID=UPI002E1AF061|nr:hypothetical protein [Oceanobacillus caeni]